MITVGTRENTALNLSPQEFTNHVAIFGRSGSGKTALAINLMEQLVTGGVSILAIDIKGDLVNILEQNGELQGKFRGHLLTPGGDHGEPINMFASLSEPHVVTSLLNMIGVESSRTEDSYHLFLSALIREYQSISTNMELEELLPLILDPPFTKLGMMDLEDVLSSAQRKSLAVKLNNLIANDAFSVWRRGVSLDFDTLLDSSDKPSVTVISVAHLVEEDERMMALAFVFHEYLRWTLRQSGTKELRTVMVVDECQGLLPPHPKMPVTKPALITLLKQARAFGNGIILGTQNVKAVDYQALGQCATWLVGQLKTKIDRTRILEGLVHVDLSQKVLDAKIAGLSAREFLVTANSKFGVVRSLDCATNLRGPKTDIEITALFSNGYVSAVPAAYVMQSEKPTGIRGIWSSMFG